MRSFLRHDSDVRPTVDAIRAHFPLLRSLSLSGARVDLEARVAHRGEAQVGLTAIEVRLLRFFAAHADRVVADEEIGRAVWGDVAGDPTKKVASALHRLRRKVEADPNEPRNLRRSYGAGTRFVLEPASRLEPHPVSPSPSASPPPQPEGTRDTTPTPTPTPSPTRLTAAGTHTHTHRRGPSRRFRGTRGGARGAERCVGRGGAPGDAGGAGGGG